MKLTSLGAILLLGSLAACTGKKDAMGSERVADSSGGSVALGLDSTRDYRPIDIAASGSVGGVVTLQAATADSTVPVVRDPQVCGDSASLTETRSTESSLAGVLVWIEAIGAGKAVSSVRRETLTVERCRLSPRLLVVTAGATVNVLSRDPVAQHWRFYREGAAEPLEEIRTMDAGQVVPSEKIARLPGMVEARSALHPWSRAYIVVFDHPYHAITDDDGAFTIDGLPPGTYTVRLWHERMAAPMEQRAVVTAEGKGRLEVSVALQ